MTKNDIVLIATPFLLTAVLIVVGYSVLVKQTPEASIFAPLEQSSVEIITDGNIARVAPKASIPENMASSIQAIPQNSQQLTELFKSAKENQTNMIYLSVPLTTNDDMSIKLNGADQSSEENIIRWTKRTISQAHEYNYLVVLALTLNASTVINDQQTFMTNYLPHVDRWAGIASEYSVSFFSPGITVGHPLYSSLTPQQMSQLIGQTQGLVRKKFSGPVGLGLCCTNLSTVNAQDFAFFMLIPTPEYPFETLEAIAKPLAVKHKIKHLFYYDRNRSKVTNNNPDPVTPATE